MVATNRCKRYEQLEAGRRAMRGQPLLARLDGRALRTYPLDPDQPFEPATSRCLIETTRFVVQQTQARIGSTQRDEITLAWYEPPQSRSEYLFDGCFQKIASVLAGMASARFCQLIAPALPARANGLPHFDCCVWQVPTLEDAVDMFVWREEDALPLQGAATYVQRRAFECSLSPDERLRIPERHRPAPDATFLRTEVVELDLSPVRRIGNLMAVLFEAAEPEAAAD